MSEIAIERASRRVRWPRAVSRLLGVRKLDNGHHAPRRVRIPDAEPAALRVGILAAAVECYRPSALLVDKHPLGAGGKSWALPSTVFGGASAGGQCSAI